MLDSIHINLCWGNYKTSTNCFATTKKLAHTFLLVSFDTEFVKIGKSGSKGTGFEKRPSNAFQPQPLYQLPWLSF